MKNKIWIILCLLLFQYINVFGETLRPDASAFPDRTIIIGPHDKQYIRKGRAVCTIRKSK